MDMFRTCMAGAFVMGPLVTLSAASQGYIMTAESHPPMPTKTVEHSVHLAPTLAPAVTVVRRSIVAGETVVSRPLSEQPVHAHLIEMRVNKTAIYLDPDVDYQYQNGKPIDDNHSILRAQRLARALAAPPVQIVRNPYVQVDETQPISMDEIQPRAIFQAPPRRPHADPSQKETQPAPSLKFPKVASTRF